MTIARLNWPYYCGALVVLGASLCALLLSDGLWPRFICGGAAAGVLYFLVGSLGVSHLIYDRSDLYRFKWLDRALRGVKPRHAIFCHSGFDEASESLRENLGGASWKVLDHFDESRMTESSIRRARQLFAPTPGTLAAPYDGWPINAGSVDVVFGLLAIHELRPEVERSAWFAEAKRCLREGGRIVLVEHIRDVANFVAFGPGFLHFHSRASWSQCWESAGLRAIDEFRITPWVRVFVIVAP